MKTRIFVFLCMSFFGLFAFLSTFHREKPVKEAIHAGIMGTDSMTVVSDSVLLSPADHLLAKARDYITNARYDSAEVFAEQARHLYEEEGNKRGIIQSVYEKSDVVFRTGKFSELHDMAEKNISNAAKWLGENDLEYARGLNQLGLAKHKLGEYEKALELQKQALRLQIANEGVPPIENARVLNNIGVIYAERGLLEEALSYYTRSVQIARSVYGTKHRYIAQNYNNIGNLYKNLGDYGKALEYHREAMSIREEVFGADHPAVAASQYNIGNVFGIMGELDHALLFHHKSLQVFNEYLGGSHPYIQIAIKSLAQDLIRKGEYTEALAYLDKNLDLLNDNPLSSNLAGGIYREKGKVFSIEKRFLDAEIFYKKALEIHLREEIYNLPEVMMALNDLASLYHQTGFYDKALHYNLKAFEYNLKPDFVHIEDSLDITQFYSVEQLQESLFKKAQILFEYGSSADTDVIKIDYLERSLNTLKVLTGVINQNRRSFEIEESKLFLNEQLDDIISTALSITKNLYELTGDTKYLQESLYFMEQGKTTILRDAINESKAIQFSTLPDSIVNFEKRLRADLTFYNQKIRNEELKGVQADSLLMSRWQSEAFELNLSYSALRDSLEINYENYYNLKYNDYVASLGDVRGDLIGHEDALLEYFIGADSLYILAITQNDMKLVHAAYDSTLNEHIARFRTSILIQDMSEFSTSGFALYEQLISPVLDVIEGKAHWIIAPHKELNYVPFEALPKIEFSREMTSNEIPYLLQNHSFRYIYSATIEIQANKRQADSWSKDFIAFAPVFEGGVPAESAGAQLLSGRRGKANTIVFEVDGETVSWPRVNADSSDAMVYEEGWGYLPYTRYEVEDITRLFKDGYSWADKLWRNKTSVYMEEEATEAQLKSVDLTDHRFVHFATHGAINESIPELSGIVLAQDTTGGEDGVLHLGEVYNLELDADLVVLSACETGLGKLEGGEGIIGLARGFKYAGANALLVSLWPVDDASTQQLMTSFYSDVLEGKAKAEAVREAKLKLINESYLLSNPFYWAGFILIGE